MKFFCDKYGIKLITFGTIEGNSHSIGKKNRAIIGICDSGLAKKFQELVDELQILLMKRIVREIIKRSI